MMTLVKERTRKDGIDLTTPFNEVELEYFKNLILKKRKEAEDELEYLRSSLENTLDADDADSSSSAHHIADVGSDTSDIQLKYTMIERSRTFINQLNRALERIENGTYGVCRATGKPIPKGRLEIAPHTRYTVEAKLKGLDR